MPQWWVLMPLVGSFHQGRLKIMWHAFKYKIYSKEAKEKT
jgi:hypothetical protein